MGRSLLSQITKMNSNICLILFGVLIAHVVLSTAENTEDNNNLSEVALSRIARAANADPGPGRNKASKKNKKAKKVNTNNKKAKRNNRKNKKARKTNKKNNKSKKATRRNKKSKKANRRNKKSKNANKKNKKSKKANRKNKNSRKANRKNRKSKKANKKRTKKQNKSRKNNSQKSALRQEIPEVPEICLTEAVKTLYNGLAKKASYFERQVKRIEKRVPIIANKLEKAGDYNQAANNMANIVPSCPNNLTFTAEFLSFELGLCNTSITENCQPPIYNQTQIDECKPIVTTFMQETEVCYNLTRDETGTDACECWESEELKKIYDALAGCNIKESNENVTNSFKECKKAVSECNRAETDAFPVYVNCSNNQINIDDLKKEAELLANNINALTQAVTAVEKAIAPARRRIIRAAATTCSDFIGLVEKLAELAPASTEITAVAEDIVNSDVTCTAEEKLELDVQKAALEELIVEAKDALAVILEHLAVLLPGTTLDIVTTPLPTLPTVITTTTAGTRRRMRGFVNQFVI